MPYPNFYAARVKSPGSFVKKSIRYKKIGDGVFILHGFLKSSPKGSRVVQAYRFDKKKFSKEEARNWLKKQNISYIEFAEESVLEEELSMGNEGKEVTLENIMDNMFGTGRRIHNKSAGKSKVMRNWFSQTPVEEDVFSPLIPSATPPTPTAPTPIVPPTVTVTTPVVTPSPTVPPTVTVTTPVVTPSPTVPSTVTVTTPVVTPSPTVPSTVTVTTPVVTPSPTVPSTVTVTTPVVTPSPTVPSTVTVTTPVTTTPVPV